MIRRNSRRGAIAAVVVVVFSACAAESPSRPSIAVTQCFFPDPADCELPSVLADPKIAAFCEVLESNAIPLDERACFGRRWVFPEAMRPHKATLGSRSRETFTIQVDLDELRPPRTAATLYESVTVQSLGPPGLLEQLAVEKTVGGLAVSESPGWESVYRGPIRSEGFRDVIFDEIRASGAYFACEESPNGDSFELIGACRAVLQLDALTAAEFHIPAGQLDEFRARVPAIRQFLLSFKS